MASFNPLQTCNRSASMADIKTWVAKQTRRIEDISAAKRRLRTASKAVDRCAATPGCSPVHHVALAQALRAMYSMGDA